MHDAETRALRRAATLLLAISCARLAWGHLVPAAPPAEDSVLPELSLAVGDATTEAERRSRPLAEDERLDPNRASAAELDRLPGIGPSTADAIVAAREAGAVYRRADDLVSVRGIGPVLVRRIGPLLDFRSAPVARPGRGSASVRRPTLRIDLNRAGPEGLQNLPGVGPALADRIIARRRERPFATVEDLLDVRGIGPATLARIRPHATVGGGR